MSRHKLRLTAAALCAAALVAGGCGQSEYSKKVHDAVDQFNKDFEAAGHKVETANPKDRKQFATALREFQLAVRTFEAKLEQLKPSGDAKAAQARMLAVADKFSHDVSALRKALAKGDVTTMQRLQGKVLSEIKAVQSARNQLLSKAG